MGAAQTAQLVILAGGGEKETAVFQPYFDALGKKTISFGTVGKGNSAKLAINLLLGITGQAIAETLVFAEKSGLDQDAVIELVSQSGMNTGLFQIKKEMYRQQEFPAQLRLELMLKDLGLITTKQTG